MVYISWLAWLVIVAQFSLMRWAHLRFEAPADRTMVFGITSILVKLATTIAAFQIVNLALLFKPRLRRIANLCLTFAFLGLLFIHWRTEHALDFFLVGDNFAEIFVSETWTMLLSSVPLEIGLTFIILSLVLVFLASTTKVFDRWPAPRWYWPTLFGSTLVLFAIIASPLYVQTDFTYFVRSGLDYTFSTHSYSGVDAVGEYPYLRQAGDGSQAEIGRRPHIFIVLMESFNANFVNSRTEDGKDYTPTFNSLIDRGLYVENFYGNSVQSSRARVAVLCSILPSLRGKISERYPDLNVNSLPDILRSRGYRTFYFDGYHSLDFDNMEDFLPGVGFDECHAMDSKFVSVDESQFVWGWGLQDDHLYRKVFEHLDKRLKSEKESSQTSPFFTLISTVSHHYPFDYKPAENESPYPNPTNKKQKFANSLHRADGYLKEFITQLENRPCFRNSLIIITGDHSFPAGEHGIYHNEQGFYEETFRVPCLILWNGHIEPETVSKRAHCQLDIAPTILDLLDIHVDNHFLGASMLNEMTGRGRAIHLIQPYDGTHLCVVKDGMKYVQSVRIPGEYLFDLTKDPDEEHNIIDDYRDDQVLDDLRKEMSKIWLNQMLIERNRIWPPE